MSEKIPDNLNKFINDLLNVSFEGCKEDCLHCASINDKVCEFLYENYPEQYKKILKIQNEPLGITYLFDKENLDSQELVCLRCKHRGTEYKIVTIDDGFTDDSCCWGKGYPKTKRLCTGCGYMDGPWVDTKYTGWGY